MLGQAHQHGVDAALARYGIKTAVEASSLINSAKGLVGGAKNVLFGEPGKAFVQGRGAFSPGGLLSHENIWWPKTQGLTGARKVLPWLQRAGTMAIPFQLMSSAHQNPHEGMLSNVLGTAGSIAGTMYGMPALGMVGAPMLSRAGASLGHGIGHMLGSKPKDELQP